MTNTITQFICPGCRFLKQDTVLSGDKVFYCSTCAAALQSTSDIKKKLFFSSFASHLKKGYRCSDCLRFIPQPLIYQKIITCPYYDCLFVGEILSLKEMRHPLIQFKTSEIKEIIPSLLNETLTQDDKRLQTIKNIIKEQIGSIYYSGTNATLMHKLCIYQAYLNLIDQNSNDMIDYMITHTHKNGMQHRIFQEYIKVLENKLPFSFQKERKTYQVSSLLDNNLNIFDGISVFDTKITKHQKIKNHTKEIYFGSRKGSYVKPYYIGKLLDVIDLDQEKSILSNVDSYSFSVIKVNSILPGTRVRVSHLRIPPHYTMGSMSYLNRIQKKIVDAI